MRENKFTAAEIRIRFITPEPYGIRWGVSKIWGELYFTIMWIITCGKLEARTSGNRDECKKTFENEN